MATTRKITSPITPASPAPATVPQAPEPAKTLVPVPAKLPARKRVALEKSPATPVEVPQTVLRETPEQPAPVPARKTAGAEKLKKSKRVRDSFSMPKVEYAVLDGLKQRAALLQHPVKKSELVRAGIQLLAALPDDQFSAALARIPGRTGLEK